MNIRNCCNNPLFKQSGFSWSKGESRTFYSCQHCSSSDAEYEPELGQLAFGNPFNYYSFNELDECGNMEGLLRALSQKSTGSSGYSNHFNNAVFSFRPYYWGDDETISTLPNFKHNPSGLEIRWYKYIGRGMTCNMEICFECFIKVFLECLGSLYEK